MNKTQLVDALAARIGDRRTAASAVDGVLDIIVDTVGSGGSVSLTGFGVFEARARAARVARNPRTGETVAVPPTVVPSFRPGIAFKATVSGNGAAAAGARPAPARRPRGAAAAQAAEPAVEAVAERPSRARAKAGASFAPDKAPARAAAKSVKVAPKAAPKIAPKAAPKVEAKEKAEPKAAKPKKAKVKK
jgi:DNA-binding protein HU-beta